jgi:hypothetical protein
MFMCLGKYRGTDKKLLIYNTVIIWIDVSTKTNLFMLF